MEVVRNLIYADNTTVIVGTKLIEIMEKVRKTSKETSLPSKCPNTKVKTTGNMEDVTVALEMVRTAQVWTWPPRVRYHHLYSPRFQ